MDDSNIILNLKAVTAHTIEVFKDEDNADRFLPSEEAPTVENIDDCSRETTPFDAKQELPKPRIQLTFNKGPKQIEQGFTFGKNPTKCDVYAGKGSISALHFSITFDRQGRLVLRDSSSNGTWVTYNGQGTDDPRHHFTWILFREFQPIEVQIGDPYTSGFLAELELPSHETCEAEYQANIASYLEESPEADAALSLLDIASQQTTAAPSASLSPKCRPQYYKTHVLGEGEFGIVRKAVDVSTGLIFAAKEFHKGNWRREVEILESLSHV